MLLSPVIEVLSRELPLDGVDWDDSCAPQAAVLVALTAESEPRVVLGRRASGLKLHPGEIAFPGGKREPEDAGPWVTARREAKEEVGIAESQSHAIGELDALFTRTGFEVHPCVAHIPPDLSLTIDQREFESVFLAPLAAFAEAGRFEVKTMRYGEQQRRVPFYELNNDTIWGVTAVVLAQLANIAYDARLDLQRDWTERA